MYFSSCLVGQKKQLCLFIAFTFQLLRSNGCRAVAGGSFQLMFTIPVKIILIFSLQFYFFQSSFSFFLDKINQEQLYQQQWQWRRKSLQFPFFPIAVQNTKKRAFFAIFELEVVVTVLCRALCVVQLKQSFFSVKKDAFLYVKLCKRCLLCCWFVQQRVRISHSLLDSKWYEKNGELSVGNDQPLSRQVTFCC